MKFKEGFFFGSWNAVSQTLFLSISATFKNISTVFYNNTFHPVFLNAVKCFLSLSHFLPTPSILILNKSGGGGGIKMTSIKLPWGDFGQSLLRFWRKSKHDHGPNSNKTANGWLLRRQKTKGNHTGTVMERLQIILLPSPLPLPTLPQQESC